MPDEEIPLRGDMLLTRKTDLMEALHNAAFRASVAAAGCNASKPDPDDGIDWIVTHRSRHHTIGRTAHIEVQLRSTSRISPPLGDYFPFALDGDTFERLTEPTHIPRILIVCVVPASIDRWIYADTSRDTLHLRHLSYWYRVQATEHTGKTQTTVQIPTAQIFDDLSLCEIMSRVGKGGAP